MTDRTIADDAKKAYGDGWEKADNGHEFSNHRTFEDSGSRGGIYHIEDCTYWSETYNNTYVDEECS